MHLFQFSMPIQTLWYVFFSWTRAAFYGMLCFVTGSSSVRLSHLKRTLSTWHFCSCSEAFLRQLLQPWIRWSETPFRKFGDFGVSLCRTWGLILSTGAIFFDILNQQTSNKIQTQSDRGGRIWALRCAFGIQSCIWELLDWSLLINVVWIWSPTWQNECDIQILQQEEKKRRDMFQHSLDQDASSKAVSEALECCVSMQKHLNLSWLVCKLSYLHRIALEVSKPRRMIWSYRLMSKSSKDSSY